MFCSKIFGSYRFSKKPPQPSHLVREVSLCPKQMISYPNNNKKVHELTYLSSLILNKTAILQPYFQLPSPLHIPPFKVASTSSFLLILHVEKILKVVIEPSDVL